MAKRKQRKSVGKSGAAAAKPKRKTQSKAGGGSKRLAGGVAGGAVGSSAAPIAVQADTITEPTGLPNASTLLDELQQRCESLRHWQRQANEDVQGRLAAIADRECELEESARRVEHERTHLDLDLDALKRAQVMFEKEKSQVEQTQQALEVERQHLERSRAELNDQKQELQELRCELDAEWASVARVRRAHESLAAALEADRERVQELRLAEVSGNTDAGGNGQESDDAPGLSLTQAA
jgi:chromosome segregation ATPase